MLDFLTPELFNALIIACMLLGLLLVGWRFYRDMTRDIADPAEQREQVYDESSRLALSETDTRPHQAASDSSTDSTQQTQ
jgi:hypothetical protein